MEGLKSVYHVEKKGALNRLIREGCAKYPQKGGKCIKHGGTQTKKPCKEEGCSKRAQKGDKCTKHGGLQAKRLCEEEKCIKIALKGGKCIKHGGSYTKRPCKEEGCAKRAQKGSKCWKHGGNYAKKQCNEEGCVKRAHKGGKCWKHGETQAKYSCKEEGCVRWARKGGKCMKHGGTQNDVWTSKGLTQQEPLELLGDCITDDAAYDSEIGGDEDAEDAVMATRPSKSTPVKRRQSEGKQCGKKPVLMHDPGTSKDKISCKFSATYELRKPKLAAKENQEIPMSHLQFRSMLANQLIREQCELVGLVPTTRPTKYTYKAVPHRAEGVCTVSHYEGDIYRNLDEIDNSFIEESKEFIFKELSVLFVCGTLLQHWVLKPPYGIDELFAAAKNQAN
uniref:Uncharacterized protein n=1 Tax=Timema bartmani TaxID=61472 RepID=A0A7R9EWV7_9NEOP|nr:unnamed protein product [Timema bartmani]